MLRQRVIRGICRPPANVSGPADRQRAYRAAQPWFLRGHVEAIRGYYQAALDRAPRVVNQDQFSREVIQRRQCIYEAWALALLHKFFPEHHMMVREGTMSFRVLQTTILRQQLGDWEAVDWRRLIQGLEAVATSPDYDDIRYLDIDPFPDGRPSGAGTWPADSEDMDIPNASIEAKGLHPRPPGSPSAAAFRQRSSDALQLAFGPSRRDW